MELPTNNTYLKDLSNYYDKIYLISIKRTRREREQKYTDNFTGLKFEFFEGTDGTLLSEEEISKIADLPKSKIGLVEYFLYRYGEVVERTLKRSEVGVAHGHRRIYQEMIDNGYKRVLVLEDDTRIDFGKTYLIPKIIKEIPDNCDLLYWGYRWYDSESTLSRMIRIWFKEPFLFLSAKLLGKSYVNLNERYPKPFRKHLWKAGYHAGSHAYGITRSAAEKLLKANTPITMISDQLFIDQIRGGFINAYVAYPMIMRDDQSFSSSII